MRFAGCTVDLHARRVFRGEREMHLSPKAFELLKVLIESRPRALSKTELLERVWPGVFVSESSLARTVNEIREQLGGGDRNTVVRTVHGYGYAFAAAVEDELAQPAGAGSSHRTRTWLVGRDREIALPEGHHVAGRDPAADIWLDSAKISRRHARFSVSAGSVVVEDLGSKNGTFVGGIRVSTPVPLKAGDQVCIGPLTFIFRAELTPESTETEIRPALPGSG